MWDIENPHLYYMDVHLTENGAVLDSVRQRFGFREFWADGQNFMLNGTRINLRGDSWHFQGAVQQTKDYALNWCRTCKEYGVNSIRYHANPYPSYYLDAADEMGILIVDETAIYGSGKSMDAANPEFLDNCRRHIRNFVQRDKNHPSVVIWSLRERNALGGWTR
ncbi:MAG: glycoside hydrolase family 2 TIM barrel-domain containing protein [Clostridia bacterium]